MSLLGGKGGTKVIPEFTGLQVNTAVQVLPIPIIYGAPRVNINLIYYNGFAATKVKTGGKGILTGGKGSFSIEYFATLLMAVGEGILGETMVIYQDSGVFIPSDYPTNGAAFFNGSPNQAPWFYITSTWPSDARPYKDTAYYAFYNAQLDSSATVPQIDLVLQGHYYGTSPLNNSTLIITTGEYDSNGNPLSYIGAIPIGCCDADPALVVWDFLTNPTYGAGFPQEWIDSSSLFTSPNGIIPNVGDSALSTYCQATGMAWSVVLNNAETANSIIERWMKNLNVAPVWTGATLKFIPYWDNYEDTNLGFDPAWNIPKKYYAPNVQTLVNITMDHILQSEAKDEDPITFQRKDPMEVYNTVRVDYRDRFNFYNDVPAEAKDEAHVELYGPRVDNIGLANEFNHANYGQQSATMQLRRNIGVMTNYTWRMGPLWAWLSPMDLVVIPDPTDYSQWLTVRILSVEDDEDENVTIQAEEFLPVGVTIGPASDDPVRTFASGSAQSPASFPGPITSPPDQVALNNPPGEAFAPVVFEPTSAMLTALGYATPQIMFGASGGRNGVFNPNWGGCNIWISLDNVNYTNIGELQGPSIIGQLTTTLPNFGGTNPDNTDTLIVNLVESGGVLENYSPTAAAAGASICVVQDANGYEIVGYTTATLSAPNTYSLTGLYRGLYGTHSRAFGTGSQFLYVGNGANIFVNTLPPAFIGMGIYVKPQSFNVFQQTPEALEDVTAYYYGITGSDTIGGIGLSDTVASSDHFSLAGQYFLSLSDSITSSDHTAVGPFLITINEFVGSSEAYPPYG